MEGRAAESDLTRAGAVLADDSGNDDQKCAGTHDEDPRAGLAGIGKEDARGAVDAFDEECRGKGEEQGIAGVAPEAEKIERRKQRGDGDDAEEKAFYDGAFHYRSPSQMSP